MIAILGRRERPDEARARRAIAAVPYPTPDVTLRLIGDCLLGIATRPDFIDESISVEGPLMAILSGRIDNAAELYRELEANGTPAATRADADVIVAAFRAFGPMVVNRFRGVFSGAVTDGRTLWAFRDHIGLRPLCFRDDESALTVAGQPRQVVVATGIKEEPNLRVLQAMFEGQMPSNIMSALDGVSRVPQAALLTGGLDGSFTLERYWHPNELLETARMSESDARDRFIQLLKQATRRSLTGRDAVLLSGGLDSPMVAAAAAPQHLELFGRPLGAVSAVFPDLPNVDEQPLIELVAKRFGMELHTYRPQARTLDDVESWGQRFGTPVPTLSIPEVSEAYALARSKGYQNVMTGEFAELVFGKWPHLLGHLLVHGRLGALATVMRAEHARGRSYAGLIVNALTAFVPGRLANVHFRRKAPPAASRLPDWMLRTSEAPRIVRSDYMPSPRERWRRLQLAGTTGATVSAEADAVVGFMHGVTIRRPLGDIDLWEFFLSLRAEIKFPIMEWKALARRSIPGFIPDEILYKRTKTLFNDHVMQQIDYARLERFLGKPRHRLQDIDYDLLRERIERRELGFLDWLWARELTRIHAFLDQW